MIHDELYSKITLGMKSNNDWIRKYRTRNVQHDNIFINQNDVATPFVCNSEFIIYDLKPLLLADVVKISDGFRTRVSNYIYINTEI